MGLLEALQAGASGPRPREAVTRHLTQVLGSTRQFSGVRDDFGVSADALLGGAMAESAERAPIERVRLELLRNVLEFETGLLHPELNIRYRDAHGNVHLELTGELADGSGAGAWELRFSTWSREIHVSEVR